VSLPVDGPPGIASLAGESAGGEFADGFHVRLDNFEGPFDLLLSLISRRQLDVTEVALSKGTSARPRSSSSSRPPFST